MNSQNLEVRLDQINKLTSQVTIIEEPYLTHIPYPQADDIEKVRRVVECVYNGHTTREQLTEIHEFTLRQADYYANAGGYLWLLTRMRGNFLVINRGQELAQLKEREKLL